MRITWGAVETPVSFLDAVRSLLQNISLAEPRPVCELWTSKLHMKLLYFFIKAIESFCVQYVKE